MRAIFFIAVSLFWLRRTIEASKRAKAARQAQDQEARWLRMQGGDSDQGWGEPVAIPVSDFQAMRAIHIAHSYPFDSTYHPDDQAAMRKAMEEAKEWWAARDRERGLIDNDG